MGRHLVLSVLLAFAFFPSWLYAHVPGELLIIPAPSVSEEKLLDIVQVYGGKRIKKLSIGTHRFKFPVDDVEDIERNLKNHSAILSVEKNILGHGQRTVPNDPGFTSQWHLPNIWAPAGWDISTGSASVIIAIIDSGVDWSHPDLNDNLVAGYNFLSDNTNTNDVSEHGTAVAGAAAAEGNSGIGITGVTWRSKIMPLVVLNASNIATVTDVAEAIVYAADHGAKVINISLAYTASSVTLRNAINYAWDRGLVIVASAANAGTSAPYYPAANDNVLAVGATDKNNQKTSWSNFGSWVDVFAPGVSIYTTRKGGGYWWTQGTSLSAPLVAALAALVYSVNPEFSNSEVVDLIRSNTSDLGAPGFDPIYSYGRINVYKTLAAILGS